MVYNHTKLFHLIALLMLFVDATFILNCDRRVCAFLDLFFLHSREVREPQGVSVVR